MQNILHIFVHFKKEFKEYCWVCGFLLFNLSYRNRNRPYCYKINKILNSNVTNRQNLFFFEFVIVQLYYSGHTKNKIFILSHWSSAERMPCIVSLSNQTELVLVPLWGSARYGSIDCAAISQSPNFALISRERIAWFRLVSLRMLKF